MRLPLENFRSPAALLRLLGVAAVGLVADITTKYLAEARVPRDPAQAIEIIPGFVHLQYTTNPGAVFGMGAGQWMLFAIVSFLALLLVGYLFAVSGRQRFYQVVLGMLLAGVLGNLYDRLRYQEVRDMIHIFPAWGIFPYIFNVADMLLCVGVALMFLYTLIHGQAPAPDREKQTGESR